MQADKQDWQQRTDAHRGNFRQRGYTTAWDKLRKTFLINHPLCVLCAATGRTTAATVADHIVPHRGDKQLMWDQSNLQPLCRMHHDAKTQQEVTARRRDKGDRRMGPEI